MAIDTTCAAPVGQTDATITGLDALELAGHGDGARAGPRGSGRRPGPSCSRSALVVGGLADRRLVRVEAAVGAAAAG